MPVSSLSLFDRSLFDILRSGSDAWEDWFCRRTCPEFHRVPYVIRRMRSAGLIGVCTVVIFIHMPSVFSLTLAIYLLSLPSKHQGSILRVHHWMTYVFGYVIIN